MTSPVDVLYPSDACAPAPGTPPRHSSSRAALAALQRADRLCVAGRPRDALAAVLRPLGRPPRDPDLLARLRIARGLALWLTGPPAPAGRQIAKALRRASEHLTRARALEAHGLTLVGEQRAAAREAWQEAARLYREARHPAEVRALQRLSQLWRDAGDLGRALALQDEAIEVARRAGEPHWLVEALTFRATLLTLAGRLEEARADLTGAWSEDAPPPARARWNVARAMLDLTQGDLAGARSALADAQSGITDGSDARTQAEVLLLLSDIRLAEGDADGAESDAALALAQFRAVADRAGETRSRVRRTHALLAAGRDEEALREARRAVKAAGGDDRPDLRGLALIALGRACLRVAPDGAASAFAAALRLPLPSAFVEAARLGSALARGAGADDADVVASLSALESQGDRRILSYCLGDLRDRLGEPLPPAPVAPGRVATDPSAVCLVAVAEALAGDEPAAARFANALHALRTALPWWRAALVDAPGWMLRADEREPSPLRTGDLAAALAARGRGPAVVDLRVAEAWRRHPERALHDLRWALVVPVGETRALYLDLRAGGGSPGDRELGLLTQVARLLARHLREPLEEAADAAPAIPGLVGRSPAMERLRGELARVAAGDGCVHVFGETGTGKERVAQAIHCGSRRAGGPWVPVNASSLSDELFESELFGHVRGAFSGAVADRRGYVSEAEGGTLFLDEVTDLSPKAQAKLLRFVQDREYRRVGDPRLQRANVRLVTAANVRLEECVRQGTFRQDLMYRLCQETLALPPLRERGDDVALLARHFLREAGPGGRPLQVAPGVWAALARYAWPGNVRELQSEMARARARAGEGTVRPEHLSVDLTTSPRGPLQPLRQALAHFEREHIGRALRENGGNRARTASQLGLSRQALLSKINRLGIAAGERPGTSRRASSAAGARAVQHAEG